MDSLKFELTLKDPVLVVGVGGLGCEVLKNLALSGFAQIHIIDRDWVEVTNLNRQILFGESDCGLPKVEVAAARIMEDYSVLVHPTHESLETQPLSFYAGFRLIFCCLDNIDSRIFLNDLVHELTDETTRIYLIDGATEGFRGQLRLIVPGVTPCYRCTLDLFPTEKTYPLCTLGRPNSPEDCVLYARETGADLSLDEIFEAALERAQTFGIQGVTIELVEEMLPRIIAAILPTNAVIAGLMLVEAMKLVNGQPPLDGLLIYNGQNGAYTDLHFLMAKEDCSCCSQLLNPVEVLEVEKTTTLRELAEILTAHEPNSRISLTCGGKLLYLTNFREELADSPVQSLSTQHNFWPFIAVSASETRKIRFTFI